MSFLPSVQNSSDLFYTRVMEGQPDTLASDLFDMAHNTGRFTLKRLWQLVCLPQDFGEAFSRAYPEGEVSPNLFLIKKVTDVCYPLVQGLPAPSDAVEGVEEFDLALKKIIEKINPQVVKSAIKIFKQMVAIHLQPIYGEVEKKLFREKRFWFDPTVRTNMDSLGENVDEAVEELQQYPELKECVTHITSEMTIPGLLEKIVPLVQKHIAEHPLKAQEEGTRQEKHVAAVSNLKLFLMVSFLALNQLSKTEEVPEAVSTPYPMQSPLHTARFIEFTRRLPEKTIEKIEQKWASKKDIQAQGEELIIRIRNCQFDFNDPDIEYLCLFAGSGFVQNPLSPFEMAPIFLYKSAVDSFGIQNVKVHFLTNDQGDFDPTAKELFRQGASAIFSDEKIEAILKEVKELPRHLQLFFTMPETEMERDCPEELLSLRQVILHKLKYQLFAGCKEGRMEVSPALFRSFMQTAFGSKVEPNLVLGLSDFGDF